MHKHGYYSAIWQGSLSKFNRSGIIITSGKRFLCSEGFPRKSSPQLSQHVRLIFEKNDDRDRIAFNNGPDLWIVLGILPPLNCYFQPLGLLLSFFSRKEPFKPFKFRQMATGSYPFPFAVGRFVRLRGYNAPDHPPLWQINSTAAQNFI